MPEFRIGVRHRRVYGRPVLQYESFHATAGAAPAMRRWIFGGLLLSLALHAALIFFFYNHRLEGFGGGEAQPTPLRTFNLKRVAIPATADVPEPKTTIAESTHAAPITVPKDQPEVTEVTIAPQITELPKQSFEMPKLERTGLDKLAQTDAASRAQMDKDLNSIAQAIIKEGPRAPRQPILPLASGKGAGGGEGATNMSIPGMSNINDLLEKSGSLRAGDKAGIPGGALFEYDSYDLRGEAVEQLRKLGTLIQKNPKATFSIEGHSDSFGPPEYNLKLSEARAESVKAWLVQVFGIPPSRIQTRGFGNTKPLVSADKSKEEQAPNRRVELVVKTKG